MVDRRRGQDRRLTRPRLLKAEDRLGNIAAHSWRWRLPKFLTSAAIAGLLALTACATTGVNVQAVRQFKPGVTTRAQVIKRLGPPASVFDGVDETKTLTWARTGGLFNSASTKELSILFGPNDKMVKVVTEP